MEFVTGNLKQLYKKYLFASLFGAVVTSMYSFIDAIAIGQSVGPTGSAAMAIITPMYSITMFLSIILRDWWFCSDDKCESCQRRRKRKCLLFSIFCFTA